jgi:hypothetical protein
MNMVLSCTVVRNNRFQAKNAANLGDINASARSQNKAKKQIEILAKIVSDQRNTIKDLGSKSNMLLQNQAYQTGLLEDMKLGIIMPTTNASPQKDSPHKQQKDS